MEDPTRKLPRRVDGKLTDIVISRDLALRSSKVVREPGHVLALDGIRGLAILAVLASHLLNSNNVSSYPALQLLLDMRDMLWVGVTLFFALSGFLITGILFDTLGSERYFSTFFARRALRIFPLYYGVLFLLLILTRPLHFEWHGQAWRFLTYTINIPFTFEWVNVPSPFINLRHFWSLAVEEQFYLLWPVVIYLLRSWKKVFAATLVGAGLSIAFRVAVAFKGWAPQNHTLFGCMDALLLGGTLALLVRSRFRDRALRWGAPVFLAAIGLTLVEALSHTNFDWWSSTYLTTIGMTVLAVGTTALVAASLKPNSVTQKICSNSVLRFFGRYSYGLYVYHYSVDASLTMPIRQLVEGHGGPKFVAILSAAVLVGGISVVISVLSYHYFEAYFLKLKRYIPNPRHVRTEDLDSVAVP